MMIKGTHKWGYENGPLPAKGGVKGSHETTKFKSGTVSLARGLRNSPLGV